MNIIAGFLVTVFGALFQFVATYFTRKVATGVAVTAAMLAVTTAFYLAMKGLVSFTVAQITNEWLLVGFFAIWPSNAETCISICLGAEVVAFLYRYQMQLVRAVSGAN